jgi:exodeoxyribonuclease V beta subunit
VRFSLTAPFPTGTVVIEASAGTGKTFAIVGLATRYVAEGLAELPQLMLVTFNRAATEELRGRARARFRDTAAALAVPAAARESADELTAYLAQADDDEVAVRRARLLRALSDFDAATIATTHSFCQQMLDSLGILGHREPYVLRESVADILDDVVTDQYLAQFATDPNPPFTIRDAALIAGAATGEPHAHLVPEDPPVTESGKRWLFATGARAELARRKKMLGVRDYNDLLSLLAQALSDPVTGPQACQLVRERYRFVLVDEFQDTDPLQWDIFIHAFHGHVTLVLVGDPKQAIYSFRGAEVLSYLEAVAVAADKLELGTNRRSDPGVLEALARVYEGASFGHPEIVAHPVAAAVPANRFGGPPMRLRYLDSSGPWQRTTRGVPRVPGVRSRVARDVADDITALVTSGATLDLGQGPRPVHLGDIAVLVNKWDQAEMVRDELTAAGVPCVVIGGSSVFSTPAAQWWRLVLEGMLQPHRTSPVRLAGLTPLLGGAVTGLDADPEGWTEAMSGDLTDYANEFHRAGFAAVMDLLSSRRSLAARLLATGTGERDLTDIRHVGQLLHRAGAEEGLGLAALIRWLTTNVADAASVDARSRSRLLESDAAAVRVMTVYGAKGGEFPVVYVPFGWDNGRQSTRASYRVQDPRQPAIDVGGTTGTGHAARVNAFNADLAGESLRLFYVALTRAMCHLVLWWAPSTVTGDAPLHRLLFGRTPGLSEPAGSAAIPADDDLEAALAAWSEPAAGSIALQRVPPVPGERTSFTPAQDDNPGLSVARFTRRLDFDWRRTSYSALTAAAHERHLVASEPDEDPGTIDEPAAQAAEAAPASAGRSGLPSPMNPFPSGAVFGTLVHAILQTVDTAAPDLAVEMLAKTRAASPLADEESAALANALADVMRTPLGWGTLADVAPADRLTELEFEMPLGGTSAGASLAGVADLVARHLPADDPLAAYPGELANVTGPALRGFLTGSVDAVLRTPGGRFVIVDYKTNKLAPGAVDVAHFSQHNMAQEMLRTHYPLQALMYSVAIHRYLRWRLAGYDPQTHLGGVQYLFVRGMAGLDTPPGCGVFTWQPPVGLVLGLSDMLAGT